MMATTNSTLAKKAEAAQVPATVSPQQAIKQQIDRYKPVITRLLEGTGINVETFVAQVANAVRATPGLMKCRPETVLGAALKAAQLGLAPNDARNLCWILPYKDDAQFQLGYGGVMELARRAVPGLRFDGRAVHPNDDFDLDFGKAEPLTHRPALVKKMDRGGDAYAWYVRATFPDGQVHVHAIDREQAEYHRSFSKQPNGLMWTKSFDAAALKSCVLDMRRWLPGSPQLVAALASDERVVDVRTIEDEPDDVDEIDVSTPALEAATIEVVGPEHVGDGTLPIDTKETTKP
jgi:recombination protein RecT